MTVAAGVKEGVTGGVTLPLAVNDNETELEGVFDGVTDGEGLVEIDSDGDGVRLTVSDDDTVAVVADGLAVADGDRELDDPLLGDGEELAGMAVSAAISVPAAGLPRPDTASQPVVAA